MRAEVITGDAREVLRTLPAGSVRCIVTSPPYYGLRDYGTDGQIGLEATPGEYVAELVSVFREARRVLADDGTLWLNLGDSYAAARGYQVPDSKHRDVGNGMKSQIPPGLKQKDLIGVPWRVAFALQADGWYLRQDIIWHKPNPMPESVRDRPTKAHEYLFLLSKSERYYYDADAIAEPAVSDSLKKWTDNGSDKQRGHGRRHAGFNGRYAERLQREGPPDTRNKRSVWTVATRPYAEAHFATFPPDLIRPCVLAGSEPGDTILDPFNGSGTTGQVALEHGRRYVGIELNPEYVELTNARLARILAQPGLFQEAV